MGIGVDGVVVFSIWDGMVDWGECGDGEGGEVKVIKKYVFGTTG